MSSPTGKAAIACPQITAAAVGLEILRLGGNAVDAAIATAFFQAVIDPPMAGLGGFGAMMVARDGEPPVSLDFTSRAGGASRADQWQEGAGRVLPDRYGFEVEGLRADVGYESIGVPTFVAGMGRAHELWGTMPWGDLLAPAMHAARNGFPVSKSAYDFWLEPALPGRASGHRRMTASPACAEIFVPGGEFLEPGQLCVQSTLASTLEQLATSGYRDFYDGDIARVIAADMAAHGGHVTLEDLCATTAELVEPIRCVYRGLFVYGTPPPNGGLLVAMMLNFIEQYEIRSLEQGSAEVLRILAEAMKFAIRARVESGVDPNFNDIDLELLLSESMTTRAVQYVESGGRITIPDVSQYESPDTTHVVVADASGLGVTLTHSLGYGSGVVTDQLGFIYNNYMNVFNPRPGFVDSVAPGKKRASSMAPTIVTGPTGDLRILVGAPGATRIATAVLLSLINVIDFGLSPSEAIAAPRIDCQGDLLEAEGRVSPIAERELESLGYRVHRRLLNYDPYFARPQMAVRDGDGWSAGVDPRRDGGAPLFLR